MQILTLLLWETFFVPFLEPEWKNDMSVQMNDWGQPIGFSIESRKLPIFPQGIVLEGKFSRIERFRSDHPMEELYEAFVSKQDESR